MEDVLHSQPELRDAGDVQKMVYQIAKCVALARPGSAHPSTGRQTVGPGDRCTAACESLGLTPQPTGRLEELQRPKAGTEQVEDRTNLSNTGSRQSSEVYMQYHRC